MKATHSLLFLSAVTASLVLSADAINWPKALFPGNHGNNKGEKANAHHKGARHHQHRQHDNNYHCTEEGQSCSMNDDCCGSEEEEREKGAMACRSKSHKRASRTDGFFAAATTCERCKVKGELCQGDSEACCGYWQDDDLPIHTCYGETGKQKCRVCKSTWEDCKDWHLGKDCCDPHDVCVEGQCQPEDYDDEL